MSVRALLVLAAVLAAVVAWIVWLDAPGDAETPEAPSLLEGLAPGSVTVVELERDGVVVRLTRDASGGWRMTAPFAAEADPRRVEGLIETARSVRVERVVRERAEDLAPYGLDPPEAELRLTAAGSTRVIRLGGAAPAAVGRYVADGSSRVLLVDPVLAPALTAEAESLRERRLVPVPAEHVRAVTVERSGGTIALERRGSEWTLAAPIADRADFAAADALARAVTSIRVSGPHDQEPPAGAFDSAMAVTVATREGGAQFELGAPAGEDARWARRADGSLAGAVREDDAEALERAPDDFRERQVAFFSRSDVRELRLAGGPGPVVLRREAPGRPWRGGEDGARLDGERVEELLDEIRWLRAASFGDPGPAAGPAREISLHGESAPLGTLDVERLDPADDVPTYRVRSSWRPGFVFVVRSEALATLPASAEELRGAPPEDDAP